MTSHAAADLNWSTYTTTVTGDANGNTTSVTQANGVTTDYAYDVLDRLASTTTHPDAQTNPVTCYVLDGNGNVLIGKLGYEGAESHVAAVISRHGRLLGLR